MAGGEAAAQAGMLTRRVLSRQRPSPRQPFAALPASHLCTGAPAAQQHGCGHEQQHEAAVQAHPAAASAAAAATGRVGQTRLQSRLAVRTLLLHACQGRGAANWLAPSRDFGRDPHTPAQKAEASNSPLRVACACRQQASAENSRPLAVGAGGLRPPSPRLRAVPMRGNNPIEHNVATRKRRDSLWEPASAAPSPIPPRPACGRNSCYEPLPHSRCRQTGSGQSSRLQGMFYLFLGLDGPLLPLVHGSIATPAVARCALQRRPATGRCPRQKHAGGTKSGAQPPGAAEGSRHVASGAKRLQATVEGRHPCLDTICPRLRAASTDYQ